MLVVGLLTLLACHNKDDEAPRIETWEVRPAGPTVPLSFVADISASEAGTAIIRWSSGDHEGGASFEIGAGETKSLPLLGFRQSRSYTLTVDLQAESGDAQGPNKAIETPSVEVEGQIVEVVSSDPSRMQPGLTMLPLWGGGIEAKSGAVLDEEGEVVYLIEMDDRLHELRVHEDGLIALIGNEEVEIRELGWLGERGRTFLSQGAMVEGREGIVVDLPGRFHHDVVPLDDDGYIVIATDVHTVDLPPSYDDLSTLVPTQIEDDVIVRFDATGAIVWSQRVSAMLDENRIGFDSLSRARNPDAVAWGHTNAIWMEDDGRIGLSVRHQDEIILFDPVDGEVDWILGNPSNRDPAEAEPLLAPVGPFTYPYHAHGARRTGDRLTLFDNGNWRASPGEVLFADLPEDTEMYSRIVEYQIDEEAMTFTEVRSLDLSASVGPVFSVALGDMDLLPNGNVLGTFGRIIAEDGQLTGDLGLGAGQSRIVEFDPEGNEVWHLRLGMDATIDAAGWATWRAERIPSLPHAIE